VLLFDDREPTSSIMKAPFVETPLQRCFFGFFAAIVLVNAAAIFSLNGPYKCLARNSA